MSTGSLPFDKWYENIEKSLSTKDKLKHLVCFDASEVDKTLDEIKTNYDGYGAYIHKGGGVILPESLDEYYHAVSSVKQEYVPSPYVIGACSDTFLIKRYFGTYQRFLNQQHININTTYNATLVFEDFGWEFDELFSQNKKDNFSLCEMYANSALDNGVISFYNLDPSDYLLAYSNVVSEEQKMFLGHSMNEALSKVLNSRSIVKFPEIDDIWLQNGRIKELFIQKLLKETLNYEGLLMADIRNKKLEIGNLELWFESGVDVLITNHPDQLVLRLYKLYQVGLISEELIDQKHKKLFLYKHNILYPEKLNKVSPTDLHSLTYQISRKGATLIKNNNVLPLSIQDTVGMYFVDLTNNVSPNSLLNTLSAYGKVKKIEKSYLGGHQIGHLIIKKGYEPIDSIVYERIAKCSDVIVLDCSENLDNVLLNHSNAYLRFYSDSEDIGLIAAMALYGAMPLEGKMSLKGIGWPDESIKLQENNIIGFAPIEVSGLNNELFTELDKLAQYGIENKAYPGCQVLVAKGGDIVYQKAFGGLLYDSKINVTNNSLYDIASVTKVAATTMAVMYLVDKKFVKLGDKLSKYLPELKNTNKANMVIKDVLMHQAGLRPYIPLWKYALNHETYKFFSDKPDETYKIPMSKALYAREDLKDSVWNWVIQSDLLNEKDKKGNYPYTYSDLGFLMLQQLCERELGQPIDKFLEEKIYKPLGMFSTSFNPDRNAVDRIAPTELDVDFRNELAWGFVHDRNAAVMGGVAGHAGLFSTSIDLAKLGQMMLQNGEYGGTKLFSDEVVEEFTSKQFKENRRGLGWDKPSQDESSFVSKYASSLTFGHTGFTGTVIWIDPLYELVFVFLSNRVHPDANNKKLIELGLRRKMQDVIYKSVWTLENE